MLSRRNLFRGLCLLVSSLLLAGSDLSAGGLDSWDALRSVALQRVAGRTYRQIYHAGEPVDLYSCGAQIALVDDDDPYADVVDLVVWLELLSREIRAKGIYDAGRPYLARLESYGRQRLARLDAGYTRSVDSWSAVNESTLDGLARALNAALGQRLYTVKGGCGAGEVPVKFRLPNGSRGIIINAFRYELCQVRNINPQDTSACYGWKEITGVPMYLSGSYRYMLVRPGGGWSAGEFVVDQRRIESMFSDDRPYPIELR